ncbi:hypothetical protein HZC00_04205 [Candidatus Kaiserbacteria bacterium]|nr:hypothetical protein [Candidatus Kaiserbacteria bacterium]
MPDHKGMGEAHMDDLMFRCRVYGYLSGENNKNSMEPMTVDGIQKEIQKDWDTAGKAPPSPSIFSEHFSFLRPDTSKIGLPEPDAKRIKKALETLKEEKMVVHPILGMNEKGEPVYDENLWIRIYREPVQETEQEAA